MQKEFYTKFQSFETELTNKEKSLKKDIESFKNIFGSNANNSNIENRIKTNLESFKELIDQLHEAYKYKNAPINMPSNLVEKRQKEIDDFLASYNIMNEEFKKLIDGTYSYKDTNSLENYKNEEKYNNMDTKELIKLSNDKLKEQDEKMNEIMHQVMLGKNIAKNLNAGFKDDNEKIKDTNKKTDQVDSKIKKLSERFKNFFKKK